jgi:hypothetical protein
VADPLRLQPEEAVKIIERLYDYIIEFGAHFRKRSPDHADEGKFCSDTGNTLVPETSP